MFNVQKGNTKGKVRKGGKRGVKSKKPLDHKSTSKFSPNESDEKSNEKS